MFFVALTARPRPDSPHVAQGGTPVEGAFVNCWINFVRQEDAEALARFYVNEEGWIVDEVTELRWAERSDYEEDSDAPQGFLEAEEGGISFWYYSWFEQEEPSN